MSDRISVIRSLSEDAASLLRFFHDNVWASIRYVHHQGYGDAATELVTAGLIETLNGVYVLTSSKKTNLVSLTESKLR